jgi:hypothetical protein
MRFFSETEIKLISISVAAATVLAVGITVSVGLAKRQRNAPRLDQTRITEVELPYIIDVVIPEEFTLTGGERWYFSREPLKKWSKDQVEMFWIDPAEIGIDLMKEETDRIVRQYVEDLP